MTAPHLAAVRDSYDTVAADYLRLVPAPEQMDVLSRAMLAAFAECVRGQERPVADLGCGPGRVTAYLARLGVRHPYGVDVSGGMIATARRLHPELRFVQGEMGALDLPDGALGGILAWYSVHHTPADELPALFAEFRRVLAPGGHLLLGGHVGEGVRRPAEAYGGNPVSYASHLVPAGHLAELLAGAGFTVAGRMEQPRPGHPTGGYVALLAEG
ncbi:class I SAM-dependent methyltransferase [Kitasatospora sp. NPDC051170]|uniref:class I SAM-dependent methyltransferase n=1 Tax=Kitasatospora sp. NPDC051170 TaxID=3364056 RepID=UPI0037896105